MARLRGNLDAEVTEVACDRVALSLGIALALFAGACEPASSGREAVKSHSQVGEVPKPSRGEASIAEGEALFTKHGCMNCHRYQGKGSPTPGPELDRAGRYDADWHLAHLRDPRSKSPDSDMPSYAHLPDADLEALAAWLASRR